MPTPTVVARAEFGFDRRAPARRPPRSCRHSRRRGVATRRRARIGAAAVNARPPRSWCRRDRRRCEMPQSCRLSAIAVRSLMTDCNGIRKSAGATFSVPSCLQPSTVQIAAGRGGLCPRPAHRGSRRTDDARSDERQHRAASRRVRQEGADRRGQRPQHEALPRSSRGAWLRHPADQGRDRGAAAGARSIGPT